MDYQSELIRHPSWENYLETRNGRVVLFTTKGATSLTQFKFLPDDHLLFGRESAGVPDDVHAASDARVIIPIAADMRSFNLATSVAIGLYEALRQTGGLNI